MANWLIQTLEITPQLRTINYSHPYAVVVTWAKSVKKYTFYLLESICI